jgi:hypothetical protein
MDERTQINRGVDEWNEINELTLSVMANRNRYDKCKKTMANINGSLAEMYYTEKMYYKERIIAMTRGLFEEECENDEMNRAHHDYLKSCIEYLKWNDITDMVQQDTRSEIREITSQNALSRSPSSSPSSPCPPARSSSPSPEPPPSSTPTPTPTPTMTASSIVAFANKMCIRKKTMDDFIVISPSEENTSEKIKARLPKVRDYNNEILQKASSLIHPKTDQHPNDS